MNPHTNKVILFANGELLAPENILTHIERGDKLIAVDGGLNHMINLGLTPNLIIGDLDSAREDDVQRFCSQGVEVQKYPAEKNETDLEIALNSVLALKPKVILVVAALGNRLDQTLGNIFLLTQPKFADQDIRLIDGRQEVFLIRTFAAITGTAGQRVSLLPLNIPAVGVQTTGLKYPLENETLYPDKTRGISNQMTQSTATVNLQHGLLLCIHQTNHSSQKE